MSLLLDDGLTTALRDKEYRHAYACDFLNAFIAAQIKALRDQRDWTQTELAEHAQMKQSRISAMENVNYGGWKVSTLAKLAEAFDVTLEVRFKSFGQRISDFEQFGIEALRVPGFDQDPIFRRPAAEVAMPPVPVPAQPSGAPFADIRGATAPTPLEALMTGGASARSFFDMMAGPGVVSGQPERRSMAA